MNQIHEGTGKEAFRPMQHRSQRYGRRGSKGYIALLLSVLAVTLFLCSCEGYTGPFPCSEPKENIQRIEIVMTGEMNMLPVMKTIPEDQWDSFLEDFGGLVYHKYYHGPYHMQGPTVRITYQDNSYDLATALFGEYHKDDNPVHARGFYLQCNEDDFNAFIESYLFSGQ